MGRLPISYIAHPVKAEYTNVTGSRALDVEYQNTAGRPLLMLVSVLHLWTDQTGRTRVVAYIGETSPAGDEQQSVGFEAEAGADLEPYLPIIFCVPSGWYYRILSSLTDAPNTVTLSRWVQIEL